MNERVTESLTWGSPSAGVGPTGNGSCKWSWIRSKRSSRLAERSSFESCSASVSAWSSSRNCSRSGPSTASVRAFSRIAAKLARTCIDLTMSSSVVSIVISGVFSPTSASTAAAASRRPTSEIAARTASTVRGLELGREFRVDPLRLADLERRRSRTSQILRISVCASSSASRRVSSGTWSAPASIIVRASCVPTTTRSRVDSSSASSEGLTTNSSSIRAMRTAPTGPRNGSGDTISAADAPLMQRMS